MLLIRPDLIKDECPNPKTGHVSSSHSHWNVSFVLIGHWETEASGASYLASMPLKSLEENPISMKMSSHNLRFVVSSISYVWHLILHKQNRRSLPLDDIHMVESLVITTTAGLSKSVYIALKVTDSRLKPSRRRKAPMLGVAHRLVSARQTRAIEHIAFVLKTIRLVHPLGNQGWLRAGVLEGYFNGYRLSRDSSGIVQEAPLICVTSRVHKTVLWAVVKSRRDTTLLAFNTNKGR